MSYLQRFSGIARLYGTQGLELIKQSHVCVIGIGGVGSWVVESLARSGVNQMTIIDLDDVSVTNVNRQIHALTSTLETSKVEVMKQRVLDINPECRLYELEDFVTPENTPEYITNKFTVVIEATDSVKTKAAVIAHCKRNKIKIITIGGAGGQRDPLKITRSDLAKSKQDPLLAKVRSELRRFYSFPQNPKRNFGIECVYSTEQLLYPTPDGGVSHEKQGSEGASKMDCGTGFGAFVGVTANFANVACSRAIEHIVK